MTDIARRTVRQRWYVCEHCGGRFVDPQERTCSAECERALNGEPESVDLDEPFLPEDDDE